MAVTAVNAEEAAAAAMAVGIAVAKAVTAEAVTAATEEGEEEDMAAEDMMVDPAIPGAVVHRTGAGGIKSAAMVALIFFEVKKDK